MFRVGLFSSVKSFWKYNHQYAQKHISMVILNFIRLAPKVNHPRLLLISYITMSNNIPPWRVGMGYIDFRTFPAVRTPRIMAPTCMSTAAAPGTQAQLYTVAVVRENNSWSLPFLCGS